MIDKDIVLKTYLELKNVITANTAFSEKIKMVI